MNKDLVLIFGNFNILHPGHLRLLRFAKSLNKKLVIGLYSDRLAKDAVFVSENLRLESILSNNWVDDAFIVDQEIGEVIQDLKPYAVIKGKEYENKDNPEEKSLNKYGGQLIFSSGDVSFSSIDLLRKEYFEIDKYPIRNPSGFINRHSISKSRLIKIIDNFKKKNICVIGDIIVDKYTTCEPLGMSQEDPTIVVKPLSSSSYMGGAGIVALHGNALGTNVNFISVVGDDDQSKFVEEKLKEKVNAFLIRDSNRPTTVKERFRAKNKTLLRVSNLSDSFISSEIQQSIISHLSKIVSSLDLIILSDFNYGVLPDDLIKEITKIAQSNKVMIVADSQSSSQTGDIARFKDMHLITPTEREARISIRDNQVGLVKLAEKVKGISNCEYMFIKLGEEGLFLHVRDNKEKESYMTDRIMALNSSPVDTSGAGDSMLTSSSIVLACGGNIWESAYIGSICASIQVSRLGNVPIDKDDLLNLIDAHF
ncbi:PfkB family carbohydrate kinase [Gammaproteobacteria bacterium]|nr:PfkB family carbohydrate kinase [Gammaproteobacteria bacterium]